MEAIQEAEIRKLLIKARNCIEEGSTFQVEGHEAHFGLYNRETSGDPVTLSLLLVHAERSINECRISKRLPLKKLLRYMNVLEAIK